MTWSIHEVIFKAAAPVHIGYHHIGILKTTRYYIPGRTIWGAITANLTKAIYERPSPQNYLYIGNHVRENIRMTYFFPSVEKDFNNFTILCGSKKLSVMIPCYNEGEIKFGNLSKEEFDRLFVKSFISTSLSQLNGSAEEGSLHETEFIINKTNFNDSVMCVYWTGYIFICNNFYNINNISISKLKNALKIIYIGGDKNYGFGRMELMKFDESEEKSDNSFLFEKSGINVDKNLNITLSQSAFALAHIDIDGLTSFLVNGSIEPLIGLEWENEKNEKKGAGQKVSNANMCYVPGTRLENINADLQIGDYGVWKKIT